MRGERLDAVERRRLRNGGLQREPFVDDQRIVGIAGVEIIERRGALGHVAERQRGERRHAVGHVVGGLVLPRGERDRVGPPRRHQEIEAGIAQRAPPGARGIGPVGTAVGQPRDSDRTARRRDARRPPRASAARAAKMASGSTSRPISRAMSASPGSVSASATKAGSSVPSARIARERVERGRDPSRAALAGAQCSRRCRRRSRVASVCSACQRLNGSRSCAARNRRSSARQVGDELDRRRKSAVERGHRRLADIARTRRSPRAWSSVRTPRSIAGRRRASSGRSRPSRPTRPIASGMTIGSLLGWPGRRRHASGRARAR